MNKPHKTTNTRTKTAKTQHAKKRKKSESIYPVINLDTLKRLYDASIKLRDRKPWELLTEQDLFGFVDPVTGENAYCHITGQCGDYQALSVYRGDRGLKFILDLMTTVYTYNYTYNYLDIMLNCDKLDVSFENFPYIDEPDREILNRLKIKTWNRKKQPIFRDFLPGYYPWPVDEKGAEMLIRAIDVTLLALDKLEQVNQSFSGLFQNGQIFMFSLDSKDKSGQWQEKIVKIKKPLPEKIPEIIVDEVKIKRLNKLIKDCRGKWETGPYYIDEPVMPEIPKEGNRAFFPALLLWMEKETHFIISQALVKKEEIFPSIVEGLLALIEDLQLKPAELHVALEDTFQVLKPLTDKLGIKLIKNKNFSKSFVSFADSVATAMKYPEDLIKELMSMLKHD